MLEHQGGGLHYARVRSNRDHLPRHHIARQHRALLYSMLNFSAGSDLVWFASERAGTLCVQSAECGAIAQHDAA
jgi:hypothetical protein